MNQIKKTMIALSVLVAAGTVLAQSTESSPAGNLGVRYAEATFGAQDLPGISDNAYSLGAAVNLPVHTNIDVGLGYSHDWLKFDGNSQQSAFDLRSDTLLASVTLHVPVQRVNVFTSIALGYRWDRVSGFMAGSGDEGVWGAAAGVEVPLPGVTLTPVIAYTDSLEGFGAGTFAYGIEASRWFTTKLGGFASASYLDPKAFSEGSWNYAIGVRLKF